MERRENGILIVPSDDVGLCKWSVMSGAARKYCTYLLSRIIEVDGANLIKSKIDEQLVLCSIARGGGWNAGRRWKMEERCREKLGGRYSFVEGTTYFYHRKERSLPVWRKRGIRAVAIIFLTKVCGWELCLEAPSLVWHGELKILASLSLAITSSIFLLFLIVLQK